MKRKQNKTICVISLTWNRPEYIKRSFDSLYQRAGMPFEHYVFDDNSNKQTTKLLKSLRIQYKFKLFTSQEHIDVYKNFHRYIFNVPLTFDYYIKLDSDIEILSNKLFKQLLDVVEYKRNVIGVIPRVEGVLNADRHSGIIDFYNGHAIKINFPVFFGCCLMLTGKIFAKYVNSIKNISDEVWGVDAEIYNYVKNDGIFIQIEDVSVYHIDNTYGQRRRNSKYFLSRKRWQNIDTNDTSFLIASKYIYPAFIKHVVYQKLIQNTITFDEFLKKCRQFTWLKNITPTTIKTTPQDMSKLRHVFRVISPSNYPPVKEMKHGMFQYCETVPNWAKNNPNVCVELVTVSEDEYSRHCLIR